MKYKKNILYAVANFISMKDWFVKSINCRRNYFNIVKKCAQDQYKKIILSLLALLVTFSTINPISISAFEKINSTEKDKLSIKTDNKLINQPMANLQDKLDTYLTSYIKRIPIPGMAVTVVKEDKAIFTKGYGVESVNTKKPVTKDSSILIGSLTKSFTALALVQLEEQGKLNLNDPVVKYLPWFKSLDKKESDKITIKMLLSNTSGIKSIDNELLRLDESEDSMKKTVEEICTMPLERKPGIGFEYCNEGFNTAGLIIEAISGMKYEEYIEKNILNPLDMKNSTTKPQKLDEVNAVFGHLADVNGGLQINKIKMNSSLAAGSLLSCSSEDLSHYLITLLNNGQYNGNQIISKKGIEKLWTPIIEYPVAGENTMLSDEGIVGYGLGWNISNMGKKSAIHHGGNTLGTSSYTIIHPKTKTAVSVLFNIANADYYKYMDIISLAKNILNITEGEEVSLDFNPRLQDPYTENFNLPSNLNKKYIGEYENEDGNKQIKIVEDKNNNLIIETKNYLGTSRGTLDFASETSATIRNLGLVKSINFTTTIEGNIIGITGAINAKRKNTTRYKDFKTIDFREENLSFTIPKELNIIFKNNSFNIRNNENTLDIKATVCQKDKTTFNDLINESIKDDKILDEFKESLELLGGKLCNEKSYIINKDNKEFTKAIIYIPLGDKSLFINSEIEANIATREINQTLIPIIKSLK